MGGDTLGEFNRLLLAVHYGEMRVKLREWKLGELAYRVSLTLLRFTDLLPADAAFWEAGCGARDTGDKGAALVLLNRYIDLSEAAEEGEREPRRRRSRRSRMQRKRTTRRKRRNHRGGCNRLGVIVAICGRRLRDTSSQGCGC